MAMIKQADFYYGAFLSALLNYAGKAPSLFDKTDSRRIYKIATDKSGQDYMIYTKAVMARKNKTDKFAHWIFNFTNDEILLIEKLHLKSDNVKLALIGVTENLKYGEIALLSYEEALDCLGVQKGIVSYRINVKAIERKRGLRVYGSGRSDKINGQDNELIISRDALKQL